MDSSMSRKSDAAATRKRRSSILKSQRAPRTPFSELEFHVATPTDVSKSRRVSFSRRNGVAEFELTEATTTWKNVYEEHNKSLETSTNDPGEKGEKNTGRRVDYLGCRILDVENVDPGDPLPSAHDGNPEHTDNDKSLVAPQVNLELTEFTENNTNQLFVNHTNPMMREITDQIDMNFSAVAPLCDLEFNDDLEQERSTNMSCIEIDLNATHFSFNAKDSESDMSITDTVHSPKVAASRVPGDRKSNVDDWAADKENMVVVNPYVAPLAAENFAVNDDSDDVLVFDGKKCTFQSDINNITNVPASNLNAAKTDNSNKRRTIVYNSDQGDISVTQCVNAHILTQEQNAVSRKSINKTCNNDSNISMTQVVPGNILMAAQEKTKGEREKTIHFNDLADISMTQALPSNIIGPKLDDRRKTVVYENNEGDLSITEVVPARVIPAVAELRKTILYDNEDADISMTQVVPLNIQVEKPSERSKTVIYEDDAVDVTTSVPTNVLHEKRKTILFGNDTGDISMTQVIPTKLILPEKGESERRKTVVYEDDGGNLSMTQVIPGNLILSEEPSDKRKTIVYDNNDGDMSVTETIPNKLVLQEIQDRLHVLLDKSAVNAAVAPAPTNIENANANDKRRTIVFNDSQGDLSITQIVPEKIMVPAQAADKRKTIVFQDEAADISVTQTVPTNFIQKSNTEKDISSNEIESKNLTERTCEGHTSIIHTCVNDVKMDRTRKSDVCDAGKDVDMSFTQVLPNHDDNVSTRNVTITDDKLGNLSMTKPIPAEMMSFQFDLEEKCKDKRNAKVEESFVATNKSVIEPQDIFIYGAAIKYTNAEKEDSECELATGSTDVLETSSSKVSGSASDSTVSRTSLKIQTVDNPHAFVTDMNDDQDMKPLVDGENNTSAVSVVENHTDSPDMQAKVEDNHVSIKESILHDLLDMSDSGNDDPRENKHLMIKLTSDASSVTATVTDDRGSKESYLLIKDSDEEQADKQSGASAEETPALECPKILPIEYQEEKHHGIVGKLQHKLSELKTFINQKSASKTKNVTVRSLDPEKFDEQEETDKNETLNRSRAKKANKTENADDTNALLDMLSHFTDTRVSKDFGTDDTKEVSPIKVKGLIAIENKSQENETRRSIVPDRKSMIRSREDLLKDISMAQAMIEIDDEEDDQMNENAEDTMDETREEPASPPRSPRRSHEVVKTLKFDEDDDSMVEPEAHPRQESRRNRHEMATSPLKKTAFGETTYIEDHIRDSKTKVIPGFLKDVSNDLKQLMSDLVKPTHDPVPFETNLTKKSASTHSTQIQANLLTSSQIDLDPELQSNAHSAHSMEERLASDAAGISNKNIARALQSQILSPSTRFNVPESESEHSAEPSSPPHWPERPPRKPQGSNRVILFDHQNPLNNVLLPPIGHSDVHKYNPGVPDSFESLAQVPSKTTQEPAPSDKQEHVVESRVALHDLVMPAGDAGPPALAKPSALSDISKPMSLDESIDAKQEVKEVEVNTVIVMKGNRDLLEASSSLTLVDDALARSAYDVEIDSNSPQKKSRSPVQVIFKIKEPESSVKLDSDLTSNDDDMSEASKGKKRNYSPVLQDKHCTFAAEEVTPKPASKVQKTSLISKTKKILGLSTKQHDRAAQAEAGSSQDESSSPESDAHSEDLDKSKRKSKPLGNAVTVQQLMTEYDMDTQLDQAALNREILAHLTAKAAKSEASCSTIEDRVTSNTECESLDVVSSFASSRRNFQSDPSDCEGLRSEASSGRRAQWQPELMHEISSKNLVTECESSVNVVSKIDLLPFMGTTDCEWESRSADCWSFRLLRARLRLQVRLRPRGGDAPRSRVRADTPVLAVAVEQPFLDNKKENPIATLCVKFAEEAMRYFCGRGCARAGDVPALLRRCAGAARVAVRWGRAMHAARAHLAFTLHGDGALSLKVANIPLRSVWEVTMRIELVVADAREAPWPRAGGVRAARVLAARPVPAAALRRLLAPLPRDWGHAPRALWKIFKYLKHKTRDDDMLLGL